MPMISDWLIIKYHDALQLTTSSLAVGGTGVSYSQTLTAEGGKKPYSWAVASGSLPDGLTLDSGSGVISGTPAAAGTANFSVQVTDANFETVTKPLAIMVNGIPVITTSYLLTGITNRPYSGNLTATGGTPPYVWAVVSGSLPAGLALNGTSGEISGSPPLPAPFISASR